MSIFVDTGAFLARYLARDEYHRRAVSTWQSLRGSPLFTSNHVLDEVWTLLARRAGYDFASERALNVYASTALEILYSTNDDEMEAVALFRKFGDQAVSFTDCISFVLMRRYRIRSAFTFDEHFQRAGFELVA
jgi:hypothetical protein